MIEEREAESADWRSENPKLREPFATSSQSRRGSLLQYEDTTHLPCSIENLNKKQ